ncbi:MAG: GNAT family N-acetyltransferase [Geminicoccaceae bacterium]
MAAATHEASLVGPIGGIPAAAWDRLCPDGNPFLRHAFLAALEDSGSAVAEAGWQPLHLTLGAPEAPTAAAPLYVKSHSYGEYVFDHGWADAYERAGGQYYPKLLVAVPFTPVPGPRLLAEGDTLKLRLAATIRGATDKLGLSSAHVNFASEAEAALLGEEGFLRRRGIQFHWHNRGYRDFQDFLDTMRSTKRKAIRKERAAVAAAGVEIRTVTGAELTEADLAAFYPFYVSTVDKRWGSAYLTADFFRRLARSFAERIVLVTVRQNGTLVGAALNLRSGDTLYGRLWGCRREVEFLHFEACYYRAIDFAIQHGLARVEAGAQGMHKLQRGYEPVFTHSAHYVRDPGLREPVRRYLRQEARAQEAELVELRALLPFHREHKD